MAFINLLPWREQAEKTKEREYFTILTIVAVVAFALVFIISQFYQMRVDGQNSRNQFLKTEIKLLDARIIEIKNLQAKKKELQKRTQVVEQLQRSRNVGTQVFDEIAKIVPTGVYLTRLEKKGNSIKIMGESESNNHLANMIREIERSLIFTDAILESITTKDEKNILLSDFKMRVRIEGLLNTTESDKSKKKRGK